MAYGFEFSGDWSGSAICRTVETSCSPKPAVVSSLSNLESNDDFENPNVFSLDKRYKLLLFSKNSHWHDNNQLLAGQLPSSMQDRH